MQSIAEVKAPSRLERAKAWAMTKSSGMSIGMILLLVVASIFMVVGAYLVGQFQLALNTSGLPANSIAAQESIYTNAYNALILGSIGLIVIAAVGILQILTNGFGGSAGNAAKI